MTVTRYVLAFALLGSSFGCSGRSATLIIDPPTGNNRLLSVHTGKLVDVYGYRTADGQKSLELFRADVVISPDIVDERPQDSTLRDEEIRFDFLNANPDTLQPRLLIPREIDSEEFTAVFALLDVGLRLVSPTMVRDRPGPVAHSVVPRNGALRLTFSERLPVDSSFFYERDEQGRISGVKNTQAIQLLRIVGNPNDATLDGDFQQIACRIVVRGNTVVVDPVLLGSEGLQLGAKNSAVGLPAAANQVQANIRLAVALDGPLAIPGIFADTLVGTNNDKVRAVVRDFRSGHPADSTPDISRGFLRDPEPPRLIGAIRMLLEKVRPVSANATELTIYKDDVAHEIDQGDVVQLAEPGTGRILATTEVIADPADDFGRPEAQHVRVLVRPVRTPEGRDVLESLDPSRLPGYPLENGSERLRFLRDQATRAVLVAAYTHLRLRPNRSPNDPDAYYGDDTRYFLSFNPSPTASGGTFEPARNVSPFADAIVRFSKPIDLTTLDGFDTLFIATRDVLTYQSSVARPFEDIATFLAARRIEPSWFSLDKFRTPHLVATRANDEDGSQTVIRLRVPMGLYLDEVMRKHAQEDEAKPFQEQRHHYFLHLVGGTRGIRDLSGNSLDFQTVSVEGKPPVDFVAMEFSVDTRYASGTTTPRVPDNLAVSIVRRFSRADEDERPSYYLDGELNKVGSTVPVQALENADLFGAISHSDDGLLLPRTASRLRKVIDDFNQLAPPDQSSVLRWCPLTINSAQIINPTANTPFGRRVQNPLNPLGCRMQMSWRELDLSLSRTSAQDFNLDVEQMYWAPFAGQEIYFDEFDRVSMFLGHAEFRPEPCVDSLSRFPSLPNSGLQQTFQNNYARNLDTQGRVEYQPVPHPAFVDKPLVINGNNAIVAPNGPNKYLPLPKFDEVSVGGQFRNPLFVYRNELEPLQGGISGVSPNVLPPYIVSPFLAGLGRAVFDVNGAFCNATPAWDNAINQNLSDGSTDPITDGLVGVLALPLLADFWVYPDSAELPVSDPYVATGANGWQVSLGTTAGATPNFRVYSAGLPGPPPVPMTTSSPGWRVASGGWDPNLNQATRWGDNTVYWAMIDFLKRTTVVTAGFVDLANPHRMPAGGDPRLGPYPLATHLPQFDYGMIAGDGAFPAGTSVVVEFRGASPLDTRSTRWPRVAQMPQNCAPGNIPTEDNFPLDPRKSGDAGLRHYDDRPVGTNNRREWWTHPYNRTVTDYTEDPNRLVDSTFTNRFSGPSESFDPGDVRYVDWRFTVRSNVVADPPVTPTIDAFFLTYRLQPN
ncbi:MAG: hypothetical protein H6837_10635 [Planctomycetes bacterium]|nr:hypothetical protein [Planctomycetota bacterium]